MGKNVLVIVLTLVAIGCSQPAEVVDMDAVKAEIVKAEWDFAQMAAEEGIPAAFVAFADDSATLLRQRSTVVGREAIREYYESRDFSNVELEWTPSFVDVSKSGDMAYTYGNYVFTTIDSAGNATQNTGVFHTVWKRQEDGSWKYVWD